MKTSIHPPSGLRIGIGDWLDRSRCHLEGKPTQFFYPPEGGLDEANAAKRFCQECETRIECLEVGMYEPFGVWGGLSITERVELRDIARARGLTIRQALRIPKVERRSIARELNPDRRPRSNRLWIKLR